MCVPAAPTQGRRWAFGVVVVTLWAIAGLAGAAPPDYVIQISVDGLGSPYLEALLAEDVLPNFLRLRNEGAWTLNARTDYDFTETLPNHTTMVTGRGVMGDAGHNWTENSTPPAGETIHSNKTTVMGSTVPLYVSSVFDVAHDNGLRTGCFVSKSKLKLFDTSYNVAHGAPDVSGPDNGPAKIDEFFYNTDPTPMNAGLLAALQANPPNYSLVHYDNPDVAESWGSTGYNNAIVTVDGYLGELFSTIQSSPLLNGRTTILLTADHGGQGEHDHGVETVPVNYTIPFFVWGAGVSPNADIYALNSASRLNPGIARPDYAAPLQPIRNGDGANLALGLLGLVPIPGSTINAGQDLIVAGAAPRPAVTVAHAAFNQPDVGVKDWAAGSDQAELGFTTDVIADYLSPSPYRGVYDSNTSPRRFRMRGCQAETTFDTVDVSLYGHVAASIDILIKDTTYETDDYYRALLTNGQETIVLADVQGPALNDLDKDVFLRYAADVPEEWTEVWLVISSRTDSATGAEAVDFDNFFLRGTPIPEPACALLLGMAVPVFLRRRGQRMRSFRRMTGSGPE